MEFVGDVKTLEDIYGLPGAGALLKVADRLTPTYRAWIKASPFCAMATTGPEGMDCSPRGDVGEVVFELDEKTLAMPDRRGNNRMDSLRNIVRDGRIALMFMVAGSNSVVRVNGTAQVTVDADLVARLTVKDQAPRSVIVVTIDEVYFQCARALMRANLWGALPDVSNLPTPGEILKDVTKGAEGGVDYDTAWPKRAKETLW